MPVFNRQVGARYTDKLRRGRTWVTSWNEAQEVPGDVYYLGSSPLIRLCALPPPPPFSTYLVLWKAVVGRQA